MAQWQAQRGRGATVSLPHPCISLSTTDCRMFVCRTVRLLPAATSIVANVKNLLLQHLNLQAPSPILPDCLLPTDLYIHAVGLIAFHQVLFQQSFSFSVLPLCLTVFVHSRRHDRDYAFHGLRWSCVSGCLRPRYARLVSANSYRPA